MLVNDTMARRYWPGLNPIGKRLRLTGSPAPDTWLTVTGVVGGVSQRNPGDDPENQVYLPLAADRDGAIRLVVRAPYDPRAMVAPARREVSALERDVPIVARTMRDVYAFFENERAGQGLVLAALGTVALLLAALGVYAIMSFLVSQQSRDTKAAGKHQALEGLGRASEGESDGELLNPPDDAAGTVLGGLLTMMLSRIFYGVRPFDLTAVLGGAALLIATALVASWWPARRARCASTHGHASAVGRRADVTPFGRTPAEAVK